MRAARIALLAALAIALVASVLIATGSDDGEDDRPVTRRASAAEIEHALEHEYRCELGSPRAQASCRPKRNGLFACEVDQKRGLGTSTVELEIDGADYAPVPGC